MKYNESLKPYGIGKKQVAFNIPENASIMSIATANYEEQTSGANEGILHQANANATALSRVIAYSAATSAINNNYSSPFGIGSIDSFTIPTSFFNANTTMHFAKVKFSQAEYLTLKNNGFYLSSNGTTIIPRRSGWYLVNSLFYLGDHKGNHNYRYNAYSVDSVEQWSNVGDYLHTHEYPTLRINSVVPVVGFDAYGEHDILDENYPLGGIELEIGVYGNTHAINITGASRGWVQCMWLSPLSEAITTNTA